MKQSVQLGSVCASNNEFVNNNPVLVNAYLEASREAMEYMNENPVESAVLLAKSYGIEASVIEEQIRAVTLQQEISETAYNTVVELMFNAGILENTPKKFSELPNYDTIPKVE